MTQRRIIVRMEAETVKRSDDALLFHTGWIFSADAGRKRHALQVVRLEGTKDGDVFTRPAGALWAKTPVGHGCVTTRIAPLLATSSSQAGHRAKALRRVRVVQRSRGRDQVV